MSTILIVDDESEMVLVLEKFFKRKGYKVLSANSGKNALLILESKKKIDLMILDMRMPGLKGIEVLEIIKERAILVPVIVLTGSLNFSHFVEKMATMGYPEENVFFKPVILNNLLKHVNNRITKNLNRSKHKK